MEYVKCKKCGSERIERSCIDIVKIERTENGVADILQDDSPNYEYRCADCETKVDFSKIREQYKGEDN